MGATRRCSAGITRVAPGDACRSFLQGATARALRWNGVRLPVCIPALLLTASCATVPFEQTGSLSSYGGLAGSDGLLTKARISVNKTDILAATTARIVPTSFSAPASMAGLSDMQRGMVANTIDRLMCTGLSDRFRIVPANEPADLRVHAVITYVALTDET